MLSLPELQRAFARAVFENDASVCHAIVGGAVRLILFVARVSWQV